MEEKIMGNKSEWERMQISPHWLDKSRDYYIYARILRQSDTFWATPYEGYTVYLLQIKKAYSIEKDCYGVLVSWIQRGHPQYSDCDEDQLELFDTLEEAEKQYNKEVSELKEKFPV